jgi:hypothetical protein
VEETSNDAAVKPVQPVEPPAPEAPKEARSARILRRTLRWTLGILVMLGLGVLLAIYFFYMPQAARLKDANQRVAALEQQSKTDQDEAGQEIAGLQVRVENLLALETKNQALVTERDMALLHVAILSARADVASAQLALAKNDPSKARVALSRTGQTLKKLQSLLDADQQKAAADMAARLELALQEIAVNDNAAESDLGVLATDLLELETAYFTAP